LIQIAITGIPEHGPKRRVSGVCLHAAIQYLPGGWIRYECLYKVITQPGIIVVSYQLRMCLNHLLRHIDKWVQLVIRYVAAGSYTDNGTYASI
jgi:hypothetical protein